MTAEIIHGDCREVMAGMPKSSVDAIVTDPPYGLEFMGKGWDAPWKKGAGHGEHNAGFAPGAPAVPGKRGAIKALPSFLGGTNPTCRNCGGTRQGRDRVGRRVCVCDEPVFPDVVSPRLRAYQAWSEAWACEAYRVLKPGGHMLAFGGTRTFHRLACAIEDAGFEIRDCLSWLYGSGFPKSLDVSKAIDKAAGAERDRPQHDGFSVFGGPGSQVCSDCGRSKGGADSNCRCPKNGAAVTDAAREWQGWGTALKPAWEPIILARKPLSESSAAANVLRHGTGAINVDGCRIEGKPRTTHADGNFTAARGSVNAHGMWASGSGGGLRSVQVSEPDGRWPANVCLDEESAALLDEQSGDLSICGGPKVTTHSAGMFGIGQPGKTYRDTGGASRFFYTSKASTSERNERVRQNGSANNHPTVKPVDLMRWLCRMVTPPGGTVLDPFMGSGTTLVAAMQEGFNVTGIEQSAEYVQIARHRIDGVQLGGLF